MHAINLIYTYAFWLLLPLAAIFAWVRGGKAEQATSAAYIAATILSVIVRPKLAYFHVEWAIFATDLLLLAGLVWLAVKAGYMWLILSAALQALSCLAHLAELMEPRSYVLGYQLMAEVSGYPTLVLLAIGIWQHHRRQQQNASDISRVY